ncbi:hypothetical protein MXB_2440 [Myxobolus squamalis]|nr:hypothetical protein MXB_2440 [Myxobolus squamalis]
MNIFLK